MPKDVESNFETKIIKVFILAVVYTHDQKKRNNCLSMGCRHSTYVMILTLTYLKISDVCEKVGGFIICVGLILI